MPVVTWKHRTTKEAAKSAVQAELIRLGHGNDVVWKDFELTARVGFGAILNVRGMITNQEVVIEKCTGAMGGALLRECNDLLEKLFPGGNTSS
jgi:hypothetical protein